MIDLNKPIRWKCDKTPVTISERFYDFVVVRWQCKDGQWVSRVNTTSDVSLFFENIPPGPRRVTVWPVWWNDGHSKPSLMYDEHAARTRASRSLQEGRVGKPIEIVEEYPADAMLAERAK